MRSDNNKKEVYGKAHGLLLRDNIKVSINQYFYHSLLINYSIRKNTRVSIANVIHLSYYMSQRMLKSFRAKCKDKVKENGDDTPVEVHIFISLIYLKLI